MTTRGPEDFATLVSEATEEVTRDERLRSEVEGRRIHWGRRGWTAVLVACLATLGFFASVLPDRFGGPEVAPSAVTDLTWSVEAVVQEVEALRRSSGRLPDPARLAPILSDGISYLPEGDAYLVVGRVGTVRIEYDSRSATPAEPEPEPEPAIPSPTGTPPAA